MASPPQSHLLDFKPKKADAKIYENTPNPLESDIM